MSEAKINFNLEGINTTIQCSQEDKIKDICQKFATKIEKNINSLLFLYGGNQINMELKFKEQANSMDINNNEMNVLVYKRENDDFICPHCNGKIKLNTEKIDNIILSSNNIKDVINGIIFNIDNTIKLSTNNTITIQLKSINVLLNNLKENINKINEKLKNLLKDNNEELNTELNEIKNLIINKEYNNGRYVGQVVNGKAQGRGIYYYNNGDSYEGDFKNDKKEGKGIYYFKNGNRYEGDFKNNKIEGKGIYYYNNGDFYEGDLKNDKKEGKGIYYFRSGTRKMGDWIGDKEIGKHITLSYNGEVKINNY